ncbi:MAG: FecCD family ABC transporter permease [Beutenbergiaceae bacterium]
MTQTRDVDLAAATPPPENPPRRAWNRKHTLVLVFTCLLPVCFVISLGVGRFWVPPDQVVRILAANTGLWAVEPTWTDHMYTVITSIRAPRILAAMLVGGALAIAGAAFQGIFRNPLVSPGLLGISDGAAVGAAAAILLRLPALTIQFAALGMGLVTVFITTRIPRLFRQNSPLMLVLAGVIMSGFMTALLGVAKYVADPEEELGQIVFWTLGSVATVRLSDIALVVVPMLVAMVLLLMLRWRVTLLSLGDAEARSLGINVKTVRGVIIICATIATAGAVSLAGTVSWVGLIIPHLARLAVGEENRFLVPLSLIMGAIFMLVVDTIARTLTGSEIPLSIVTGILGAPLFLWLLGRQRAHLR